MDGGGHLIDFGFTVLRLGDGFLNQSCGVSRRLRGTLRQVSDFVGYHCESHAGFTGAGSFNGGIERQNIGLKSYFIDGFDDFEILPLCD